MDLTGENRIPAPRAKVWEALNDPEILRQCIVGCEEIVKNSPTEWAAKVTAKVGPVKARFGGKVTLSELDPPNGYRITGEGTGGAAGFAKGGAVVKLTDAGSDTLLSYTVNAQVGGKLAQIGSRLIEGTTRKMADDFFTRFAAIVGGAPPETTEAPVPEPAAPAAPDIAVPEAPPAPAAAPEPAASSAAAPVVPVAATPNPPPPQYGGLSPLLWVPLLVIVVAIVLYIFTRF